VPEFGHVLEMLDRDDALELHEPLESRIWPEIEQGEDIVEVDYGRLFPAHPPTDRGQDDFEVFGDDWDLNEDSASDILEPRPAYKGAMGPPQWDVWAWYQPIHFFGPRWGIFIRESALVECARRIAAAYHPPVPASWRGPSLLAKATLRSAFAALFLHEAYHHKVESLALRLHVVEQRPIYPIYHKHVYRVTAGTDDQIEEGLANADSWYRLSGPPYKHWIGKSLVSSTRQYLEDSFDVAPPGYRNAMRLLRGDYEVEQQQLFTEVQEGASPKRAFPADFGIATHLNQGLFRVNQRIWTVVPVRGMSILPTHPAVAPLTTRKLERFIRTHGWNEVPKAGKGSHRKFRDSSGQMVVLPDSKDVSLAVLRSTAEALGLSMRELSTRAG
jgi:predicted RNA binding protein YcfA (HicA-like mRNA interferase family)